MISVTLNNGVEMPMLGLGVYKTVDKNEMQEAVNAALDAGYRSFDTAQLYQNEDLLGEAIKNTGIGRKEVFITSKIDVKNSGYQNTLDSFEESLKKLQTDYLDLLLLHWPGQKKERLQENWKALEELYQAKKVRAIGACNLNKKHFDWIMETATIVPAVNQIERHPLMNRKEIENWCKESSVHLEAWAPLIRGNMDLPELVMLSKKYGKTPAQIILRWDIQDGYIVIPKSVHRERIFENADIFDFELSEEDMALLNSMNIGKAVGPDLETFDY